MMIVREVHGFAAVIIWFHGKNDAFKEITTNHLCIMIFTLLKRIGTDHIIYLFWCWFWCSVRGLLRRNLEGVKSFRTRLDCLQITIISSI